DDEYTDGALYEISEDHERALDGFEHFPHLYDKVFFPIDEGEALMYQMVVTDYREPRAGYVDTIRQGFFDWGLDESTLERAVARQKIEYGKDA
ncbi:MAG TPA: hypothetical protein VNI20_03840, partial [Fimbriimonadaceae bacterium]|nr:hypothetical protein [Fimbriimonadaceae bacterium]